MDLGLSFRATRIRLASAGLLARMQAPGPKEAAEAAAEEEAAGVP